MALLSKSLLIYYGYPSAINGSTTTAEAATHLGAYDMLVLGDGLQHPAHPDHGNTKTIIAGLSRVEIFGYIDLGVGSESGARLQNLTPAEIEERARQWAALGVQGVLLDDFGFDFQVTRQRQREAVKIAHDLKLRVIANAWEPDDVFLTRSHPLNRKNLACPLGPEDYYLWESYQVKMGACVSWSNWRAKAQSIHSGLKECPCRIISVTTTERPEDFTQEFFDYSLVSAALEGHYAFGWGEMYFSANGTAPFRARPEGDWGSRFLSRGTTQDRRLSRYTDRGLLSADSQKGRPDFRPGVPLARRLLGPLGL